MTDTHDERMHLARTALNYKHLYVTHSVNTLNKDMCISYISTLSAEFR